MIKFIIKTDKVSVQVDDETKMDKDGFVRHRIPETLDFVKQVIQETIHLHNEISS